MKHSHRSHVRHTQNSRSKSRLSLASILALSFSASLFTACAVETKRSDDIQFANQQNLHDTTTAGHEASLTQNTSNTLQYPQATESEPTIVMKDHHGNIIHPKMNLADASTSPKSEPLATVISPPAQAHAHRSAGPVPATQAMAWLKNGNSRFRKGFVRKDGQSMKDIARLTKGQKPHTIIVSCSDSRVPPEVVFDQKLGEVFVVRTAGQSLDASAIASIEYAVEHLGSNFIVVMGHESCGAVKATLSTMKSSTDLGSPFLNKLASNIRPRLSSISERTPASEGLVMEGWENAKGAARELVTRSEIIRRAIESGDVKMASALYHLGSGEVEWSTQ